MSNNKNNNHDKYLTFAPRGLQYITISKLHSLLNITSISILDKEDEQQQQQSTTNNTNFLSKCKAQIKKEEIKRQKRKERKKKKPKGDSHKKYDVDRKEVDEENRRRSKAMRFAQKEEDVIDASTIEKESEEDVVGCTSLVDGTNISIGYYVPPSSLESKKIIWSMPGQTEGLVPIIFTTSCPFEKVAMIRGMGCGPLLALIDTTAPLTTYFDQDEAKENTKMAQSGKKKEDSGSPISKKPKIDDEKSSSPLSKKLELNYTQSLNEASSSILQYLQQKQSQYQTNFDQALQLWYNHVIHVWYNDCDFYHLYGENTDENKKDKQKKMKEARERIQCQFTTDASKEQQQIEKETTTLQYRLSCVRWHGKKYPYKKEELLPLLSSSLLSSEFTSTDNQKWNVDLVHFDLELVVFVHTSPPNPVLSINDDKTNENKVKIQQKQNHYITIAINLRPYNKFTSTEISSSSSRSWYASSHLPPRDVIPPLVSVSPHFQNQEDVLVKLRPSTAQLLLEMADVKMGDVVLDPCGGVGTIPIEGGLLQSEHRCFNIGGDLVLQRTFKYQEESAIRSTARNYLAATKQYKKRSGSSCHNTQKYFGVTELAAWDASLLPLKDSSVDVIVSDLPFGQRCLSTHRLSALLPLMFYEFGRVLRSEKDGDGRMVLLCGAYEGIVDAIVELNNRSNQQEKGDHGIEQQKQQQGNNEEQKQKKQQQTQSNQVFKTPLESIFPVNIGGLSAWVIIARRGNGVAVEPTNYRSRVRKLTVLRERQYKHEQSAAAVAASALKKRKEKKKTKEER